MDEGDEMRPVLVSRASFFQNCSYQRKSETKAFATGISYLLENVNTGLFLCILCRPFLK